MPNGLGPFPNFQSVQQLLAAFYGAAFVTQPVESDYTIGTAAAALGSAPGGVRVGLLLSNTGFTNFAISYLAGVTIATGILLLPGGTFLSDWYYDGDLVSRPLYAISSAAGGTLHMLERFLAGA
jgi:hypothetical protein